MLQASHHQGSSLYSGSGRQCVANSVRAIVKSYSSPPPRWSTVIMDDILLAGDKLYCEIGSTLNQEYRSLEDIPSVIDKYNVSIGSPMHGYRI